MAKKLLVSGLGGGLDVINASLLYFAAKNENMPVVLGSIRPAPLIMIKNHSPFADNGTWINNNTEIQYRGRYAEPQAAQLLGEQILFLSRKYQLKNDVRRLRDAVIYARAKFNLTHMIFVDGGGDSLILSPVDGIKESQTVNPFQGGDAFALAALFEIPEIYLAVISGGLDISEQSFHRNVKMLDERGGYFGKVNLMTGEQDDYQLEKLIRFNSGFLQDYFNFAEGILVLNENDFKASHKFRSHTAVVTYHALKGNFGLRRTYVSWEPQINGQPGVIVKPEHCWMYFFSASAVESLKRELAEK